MSDREENTGSDRRKHQRIVSRIRIKFQTMKELRTEYTQNISREGLFIQTDHPLRLNDIVYVTIEFPSDLAPITLNGEVVYVISVEDAGKRQVEPGMGLHFTDLNNEQKYIIESYIARELDKDSSKAENCRRAHPRRKANIRMKFASNGALKKKYTRDISQGGVSIETKNPIPIGEATKVFLIHPTTGEELELEAKVVRHIKNRDGEVTGAAMAFENFASKKDEIERFVNAVIVFEGAHIDELEWNED